MSATGSTSSDPLLRFRREFPILQKTTYFISNSLGAMPGGAADRLREYAETWARAGVGRRVVGDVGHRGQPDRAPDRRAAGTVAMLPNVTTASAIVVSALECGAPRIGGVLKWLCGGPGGAFLYVAPDLRRRLEPALTGWMAHPAPFDFDPPPMRWRDDASRFLLGTPAIPALYAATEGPRLVREAGVEEIRAKSLRQTGLLIELGHRRGFRCAAPADAARRVGTVAVDFDRALEVSRELNARDVVVDYRPGAGNRMSPHFYTSDEELDRAFEAIDEIRSTGAWERWRGRPALVT